jgi:hypothetical protein
VGDFIAAVLERSEDGAKYESVVYDRFLTIRHSAGQVLSVFDMGQPLSGSLPVGKVYEFVLVAALPGNLQYFPTNPPPLGAEGWQGDVVDPCWRAPKGGYSRARPDLYEREWVLLATPLGRLLMSSSEIGAAASSGGVVRWQEARLDLYAVA